MANENQYYKYPFAENGNADEVPDQGAGGVVDYESGYGPDYEKAVGVEGRKRIERTSFNGIVKGITKNIKQWQERNFPTWIEDDGSSDPAVPFSYPKGIIVSHNGINWASTQEGNTDEPSESSPNWDLFESSRRAMIDDVHYIGSTILTFESASPQIKYPWQTWSLISGDASIRLGDGTTQSQTPSGGSNDPTVPVPRHAHKIDHGHPSVTTSSVSHRHDTGMPWSIEDGSLYMKNGYIDTTGIGFDVGGFDNYKLRLPYTDVDTHNHSVQIPQYVGNTDNVGTAGATIDVRGRSIKMNLWLRTA